MKTFEEIDITAPLLKEEFFMLFDTQLPLNDAEKKKINEDYFPLYALFITDGGVTPEVAFEATKTVFYSQETQIKERLDGKI
jgi:hypothetical protein